jgi:transposase
MPAGRVRELVAIDAALAAIVDPLLVAHERLVAKTARLQRLQRQMVRTSPVCRRLMTMPGTALSQRSRFERRSTIRTEPDARARAGPTSGSRHDAINRVP